MTEDNIDTSYQMPRQKLIFVGDVSVGKTSIINNIIGQTFNEDYEPSIGVDFFSKSMKYKGKTIKLQIWDSAGQEKFKSLIPNYIRGSSLIFVVYDIANKKSFDNVRNWVQFINDIETSTIILCGNKIDLENQREVTIEEEDALAKELNYELFKISAKTDKNIQRMMYVSVSQLPAFQQMVTDSFNNNNSNKDKNKEREEIINELVNENESMNGNKLNSPMCIEDMSKNNGNLNVRGGLIPDNSVVMATGKDVISKKCAC